ncbi:hypothetical protein QCB45_00700 [Thiomicrorhabdus sp. ZW0627]|uniref:hypothetical protein n=1 Tax=Thiomicrorhabdus sp. ZW0627 TaxID=3039774 RepID=UPI002436E11E|nr:hypothetical protein [Thiomicrorhabdus sp. ZW0627]MDG6772845.1 hypothetical protein [Thiomicrorhabdus sp. ZW0627]
MRASKKGLLLPIVFLTIIPLIASWFAYADHLPPGFGVFPPLQITDPPTPGFSIWVFLVLLAVEIFLTIFLLFPQKFGFKPVPAPAPYDRKALPWWFWLGAAVMLVFWYLMWARPEPLMELVYFAFTPLWWGFITVIDGVVYSRSGGYSLMSKKPKLFAITIVVSLFAWYYFEYFDYFALGNWYYPNSVLIPELSHTTVVILFLVAYTTVWPAVFEWYTLLHTFPKLAVKYSDGPKINLPGYPMLIIGLALMAIMVFYPYPFFWALWIGVMLAFAGVLAIMNIPSPISELAKGNWSPMILIALSSLFNGFFWEMWNYGSAHPTDPISNPNY